jgi:mono/diheme cytochrome c family protein
MIAAAMRTAAALAGVALALTGAVALAAVPGNPAAGKKLFLAGTGPYRCGSCHTLKAAGSFSYVGPNLDALKPAYAVIVRFVTSGHAPTAKYSTGMPGFSPAFSAKQISDVAAFVYGSTH